MPNTLPTIRGIRIRTVNGIMLALSLILFLIVLYTTVQIARAYRDTTTAMENYMRWEKSARSIQMASDYLTDQARLYARTLDKQYADKYFNELLKKRSREEAMAFLVKCNLHSDHEDHDCDLKKALEMSNLLSSKEIYAIRLIVDATRQDLEEFPALVRETRLTGKDRTLDPEAKIERARNMVLNAEYQDSKAAILNTLSGFMDENIENMRAEQQVQSWKLGKVLDEERIVLIALCLLNILTFLMIAILIVKPLQVYLRCIKNDKMLDVVGAYEFKHLALTYNDIFAIKQHHDKLMKHKAEHDPLTGLLNRGAFDTYREMLSKHDAAIGLLLADVDKFKEVNDTYGHAVGDKTLRRVAWLLQDNFRSNDLCIRMGGDEFAVILRASSPNMERIVCGKIRKINAELQRPENGVPATSLSVGVAFSNAGFSQDLYNNADRALYEVKEAGRCGCRIYMPA